MGKQATIEDQATTPVRGAGDAAEPKTDAVSPVTVSDELLNVLLKSNTEVIESNALVVESNQALIDSNTALTESIESFKESANEIIDKIGERVEQTSEQGAMVISAVVDQFDTDSEYQVSAGKSFRDPKDFAKEYTAGDNVDHLGEDVLKRLLSQGLIEEA